MHPNQYLKQHADNRPRTHRIEVNGKVKEIYAESDGHAEVLARNSVIGEVYFLKVTKL